jgi:hypothetical protein
MEVRDEGLCYRGAAHGGHVWPCFAVNITLSNDGRGSKSPGRHDSSDRRLYVWHRISTEHPAMLFGLPGFEDLPGIILGDYWIDKFEVTNKQFKEFLDLSKTGILETQVP